MVVKFTKNNKDFLLFSEYAFLKQRDIEEISLNNPDKIIIGGLVGTRSISCLILKNGIVEWRREKARYTNGEKQQGCKDSTISTIYGFEIDGIKILPIICYEICFPELTMNNFMPDLIVHLIGFPMFDKHQRKSWIALEKSLGIYHDCDVYVACGGQQDDPMIITGMIHQHNLEKEQEMENEMEMQQCEEGTK